MIAYYWRKLMMWLGYRRVRYRPSDRGVHLGDFWMWQYAPHTHERDYDENELHRLKE